MEITIDETLATTLKSWNAGIENLNLRLMQLEVQSNQQNQALAEILQFVRLADAAFKQLSQNPMASRLLLPG